MAELSYLVKSHGRNLPLARKEAWISFSSKLKVKGRASDHQQGDEESSQSSGNSAG